MKFKRVPIWAALLIFLLVVSDFNFGRGQNQTRPVSDSDVLTLLIQPGNSLPAAHTLNGKSPVSLRRDHDQLRGTEAMEVSAEHQILELHIIAIFSDAIKNRQIRSRGTYS